MKLPTLALCVLIACGTVHAQDAVWQPSAGHTQMPLWPGSPPPAKPMPGPETMSVNPESLIAGKTVAAVKNVSQPTMTVYSPVGKNTGAAVLVIPGGGFEILAMDLEGSEVCDWLTAKGVTCVLLKYRVPSIPYDEQCDCRPHNLALSMPSLQDAQRALRLMRAGATKWQIDPQKVGVLGFSAGGFLVAELSTQFHRQTYKPVDDADKQSTRPDFAFALYPGHISADRKTFNPNLPVTHDTPPTFIVQAEDDHVDGVDQALIYYNALKKAEVPAELHIYAHGGHAFGLRPTASPITHWPALAETWLASLGMIPSSPP
jgi:acetyl esterase/lipase